MGPKAAVEAESSLIRSFQLNNIPWLIHGFSTRKNGFSRAYGGQTLNLGFTKHDSRAAVERNRRRFLRQLGAVTRNRCWPLVTLRQIHSDLIHKVSGPPPQQLTGDGLITSTPRILLAVQAADCLPLILVDVKNHAVGVVHAGWRGTLKRVAEKCVGEMRRNFGTDPAAIRAAIGPGIRSCCFEVGREVQEKFESQFSYSADLFSEVRESDPVREKYPLFFLSARPPGHTNLPGKIFLDLVEANRRQLINAGVLLANIEASELCTACCPDLLFSYRAEKGMTGRMMGVAGIRPEAVDNQE